MTTQPIATGMVINQVQRVIPANGSTVNIVNLDGDLYLIIAPLTPIATLVLSWPSLPFAGAKINIVCTQNIATITHVGNALDIAFSSIKATGAANYIWDDAGLTYMCTGQSTSASATSLPFSTTVTSAGNAFVYPTDTGTSTGNPLFGTIDFVTAYPTLPNPNIACGKATPSLDLKTVTIPCVTQSFSGVTLLGINVLGSNTLAPSANTTAITVLIHGRLAS